MQFVWGARSGAVRGFVVAHLVDLHCIPRGEWHCIVPLLDRGLGARCHSLWGGKDVEVREGEGCGGWRESSCVL